MHSEWSDGSPTIEDIAAACVERGYRYAAVTDHWYGLRIAGGMSMIDAAAQRVAIEGVNARYEGRFRLLQGIEANIDAAGHLDLAPDEAVGFDVVLAAPHSRLRKNEDQTRPHAGGAPASGRANPRPPAGPYLRVARRRDGELGARLRGRRAAGCGY